MSSRICFSSLLSQNTRRRSMMAENNLSSMSSLYDLMEAYEVYPGADYTLRYAQNLRSKSRNTVSPNKFQEEFESKQNPLEQWLISQAKSSKMANNLGDRNSRSRNNFEINKENTTHNNFDQKQSNIQTIQLAKKQPSPSTLPTKKEYSPGKIVRIKSSSKNMKELCQNYVQKKGQLNDALVWRFGSDEKYRQDKGCQQKEQQWRKQENHNQYQINVKSQQKKIDFFQMQNITHQKMGQQNKFDPLQQSPNQSNEREVRGGLLESVEKQIYERTTQKMKKIGINKEQNKLQESYLFKQGQIGNSIVEDLCCSSYQQKLNKEEKQDKQWKLEKEQKYQEEEAIIISELTSQNTVTLHKQAQMEKEECFKIKSMPQKTLFSISKPALSITSSQAHHQNGCQNYQTNEYENYSRKCLNVDKVSSPRISYHEQQSRQDKQNSGSQHNIISSISTSKRGLNLSIKNSGHEQKKIKMTISPNYLENEENKQLERNVSVKTFMEREYSYQRFILAEDRHDQENNMKTNTPEETQKTMEKQPLVKSSFRQQVTDERQPLVKSSIKQSPVIVKANLEESIEQRSDRQNMIQIQPMVKGSIKPLGGDISKQTSFQFNLDF